VPTVLSESEVVRLIAAIEPDRETSTRRLMARLAYGTGMRVGELCTLRLRDVDFDRGQARIKARIKGHSPFSRAACRPCCGTTSPGRRCPMADIGIEGPRRPALSDA
jgi:integrase